MTWVLQKSNQLHLLVSDLEVDDLVLFNIATKFSDFGEKVLRVEHRLYPDLFPNQMFLEVEKIDPIENLVLKVKNPFATIFERFDEIKTKTKIFKNEKIENEEIVKVCVHSLIFSFSFFR